MQDQQTALEQMRLTIAELYSMVVDLGFDPGELPFTAGPAWPDRWEAHPRTLAYALAEVAVRLEALITAL